jgi:hypothetical protein
MSLLDTTYSAVSRRLDTLASGEHVSIAVPADDLDSFLSALSEAYGDAIATETKPVASETMWVKVTRP